MSVILVWVWSKKYFVRQPYLLKIGIGHKPSNPFTYFNLYFPKLLLKRVGVFSGEAGVAEVFLFTSDTLFQTLYAQVI